MTADASSPMDSAEAFARLCATLDDPFADRAAVLDRAGLTENACALLQERWAARMAEEGAEELAEEFCEAYAAARSGARKKTVGSEKQFSSADVSLVAAANPGLERAEDARPASAPPADVPTFMQERSPVFEPVALGCAPTATAAPAPAISTETGALDLRQLLKAPLPFDPNARDAAVVAERAPSHVLPAATGTSEVVVSKLVQPSTPFDDSTSRSAPGAASARSGAQLSTETTEIQIGALLRQAVPFDPHAKPGDEPVRAAATPSAPSGPAAPSPDRPALKTASAAFTETEELNLKDLFKRGPAVPFGAPAPVPGTAELPTVVSSPAAPGAAPVPAAPAPTGRGRWIRFDTQTGEPLATPYWEALPQAEKK